MQMPLLAPAPLVRAHAAAFRDLFENRRQFAHFEHYLTGLLVLENKSMANIARCVLDSADKTNIARFLSEADWDSETVNTRRLRYMLEQTRGQRQRKAGSALVLDDTLCTHVGSLIEYGDRHYRRCHVNPAHKVADHQTQCYGLFSPPSRQVGVPPRSLPFTPQPPSGSPRARFGDVLASPADRLLLQGGAAGAGNEVRSC